MALSRVTFRSLAHSKPLCPRVGLFIPKRGVRLISNTCFEGGAVYPHRGEPSASTSSTWNQQVPQIVSHVPVINGHDVSFPSQPPKSRGVDPGFSVDMVFGSDELAQQSLDSYTNSEGVSEEVLRSFEVSGSSEIAARLFQNVEVRAALSRRLPAANILKYKARQMPAAGDKMVARFGNPENVVALVCRFAKVAYDIGSSASREEKTAAIVDAVKDIVGNEGHDHIEVDAIVEAVSRAQHGKICERLAYTPVHVIRFLSFENVWQQLNAEQRNLIMGGCQSRNMTSNGLVDGLKAFERSWLSLSVGQQRTAQGNLSSIAQRNISTSRIADACGVLH